MFPDGKTLIKIIKETFGTTDITKEQLNYIMAALTPSSYVLEHHTVKGHPVTFYIHNRNLEKVFAHRPWQVDILNDDYPELAIMKSRQLGLSEVGLERLLHFCDLRSYDQVKCLYTFPTLKQMKDFVKTRVNPQFEQGYYAGLINPANDSLDTKQIRRSYVFFRTGSKAAAVEGVDVDYIALDEYDRMTPGAESSAIESMSSSKYHIVTRWSTPTIQGYGIHDKFTHSDQRVYMHKCDSCGKLQQLSYSDYDETKPESERGNIQCLNPDGVDFIGQSVQPGSYQFVCQRCGKPLDRWYNGQWVVTHPEVRGAHGYLITQMNAVWITADNLKEKELKSPSKQHFYNYVLGQPYEDAALKITVDDINRNSRDHLPRPLMNRGDYRFISVGIDWGTYNWVTVLGMKDNGTWDVINNFHVERNRTVQDPEADLKSIILKIEQYDPDIIMPDIGDSGNYVQRLMQIFGKDRVFGIWTKPSPKSTGEVVASFSEGSNRVSIDKLTQMTIMISHIKSGRVGFYRENTQDKQLLIKHWSNVVIRDEEDDKTGEIYKIITCKGDKQGLNGDHFAYSQTYAGIGMKHLMDLYDDPMGSTPFDYTLLNPGNGFTPTDINNGKMY